MKVELFFVLKGLLNGERDMRALTCGHEEQMPDGWYWAIEGMDDGDGPYHSREDAKEAGKQDLERYESIVRGALEQGLSDKVEHGSADALYDECFRLGFNALLDNSLSKSCPHETAQLIAREIAMNYAQP